VDLGWEVSFEQLEVKCVFASICGLGVASRVKLKLSLSYHYTGFVQVLSNVCGEH
jgi:hypothetical protein